MVSKCFNPACSTLFHSLAEGTLFRLEPSRNFTNATVEPEYFWLCKRCEGTMTLTLRDDGVVEIAAAPPLYAHGLRRDMPLAVNRSKGLLLRTVSFWPRPAHTANDPY